MEIWLEQGQWNSTEYNKKAVAMLADMNKVLTMCQGLF